PPGGRLRGGSIRPLRRSATCWRTTNSGRPEREESTATEEAEDRIEREQGCLRLTSPSTAGSSAWHARTAKKNTSPGLPASLTGASTRCAASSARSATRG